jgi:hypothetical protein
MIFLLIAFIYLNGIYSVLVRYSNVQALETRIYAVKELFVKIKGKYPETEKMDNTAIVHWALNKLIALKEA